MTNSSADTSPPQALMSTNAYVKAPPALPAAPVASNAALWAAIIGAGSALLVSFLKDFLFEWLKERRARRQSQAEVYRQYLAPLCETCEKIVCRSKEIFIDKRHAFLKTTTLPLDFRIATLIGWIRGMNLELRALPREKSNFATPISKQIAGRRLTVVEQEGTNLGALEVGGRARQGRQ